MADTPMKSEHPPHNDLHWAMSFVREDLQDVKQDIRDLRGEIRLSMVVTMGLYDDLDGSACCIPTVSFPTRLNSL